MNPESQDTPETTVNEEPQLLQTAFNFVIPNATVTIQTGNDTMPIDQALSICFHVAAANPNCKVRFYLEVME